MPAFRRVSAAVRRRAMSLAYQNAALWALGHGLTSTSLVVYFALTLGAEGLSLSLILAAPQLVGLLRLGTPLLIAKRFDRKKFCVVCYAASGIVLIMLPVVSAPNVLPSVSTSLTVLVVLWSIYHLLEYLATITLWSWLADLVPLRIRGRFIGRRQRWLTLTRSVAMLASGLFAYWWKQRYPLESNVWWLAYAIPATFGAMLMTAAAIPLARLQDVKYLATSTQKRPYSQILDPFRDRYFVRLLVYGCWFSLVNGITQMPQFKYTKDILALNLLAFLVLQICMKLGQSVASPRLGRLVDRIGNRPVMIACQAIVASGPLFYYVATPAVPLWIVGAWIGWIAYAGLNIGLPNLMLKMAPEGNTAPHLSVYFAVTGVCYGASTIAGGLLFDFLSKQSAAFDSIAGITDHYDALFLLGTVARLSGVLLLMRVIEPVNPRSECN